MTFEQIDERINNVDLTKFEKGGEFYLSTDETRGIPKSVLEKICKIFSAVKPILTVISNIPLIPKSWREVIKKFISLMENICG